MTYEAWRISYQSSEQAARAAYVECERLQAKIAEMETQEPIGEIVAFGESLHEVSWKRGALPHLGTKLYALPGAKGEGNDWHTRHC